MSAAERDLGVIIGVSIIIIGIKDNLVWRPELITAPLSIRTLSPTALFARLHRTPLPLTRRPHLILDLFCLERRLSPLEAPSSLYLSAFFAGFTNEAVRCVTSPLDRLRCFHTDGRRPRFSGHVSSLPVATLTLNKKSS